MSQISFKANFVKPVIVKKKDDNHNYANTKVSLVEIDVDNKGDMYALKELPQNWGPDNFSSDIYNNAKKRHMTGDVDSDVHTYAVTSQNHNFQTLNSDKILGVAELIDVDSKNNKLNLLQVNPDYSKSYVYSKDNRKYKNVGSSMLNSLINLAPDKNLNVRTTQWVEDFYKKHDFEKVGNSDLDYLRSAK